MQDAQGKARRSAKTPRTKKWIIQTRYRDIPWEEVRLAFDPDYWNELEGWWERHRGKPVRIEAPGFTDGVLQGDICGGPAFYVVDRAGRRKPSGDGSPRFRAVCPHVAEIGD